jgi:transposase
MNPLESLPPQQIIGIDVAKKELVIALDQQLRQVPNNHRAVTAWLKELPAGCCLAMEATGTYHQLVAELAYEAGLRVYVLNPKDVHEYRKQTGRRAKTDRCDAQLIARYVDREMDELHAYKPMQHPQRRLADFMRRRAVVVQSRTSLRLSFGSLPGAVKREAGLTAALTTALTQLDKLVARLDQAMAALLQGCELEPVAQRLRSIVGVGPVTCAALVVAFARGDFKSADAFVAALGLDLKVADSGQRKGQRRLSKRGDSQTRALLYTAAMAAAGSGAWKGIYQGYLDRGLKRIQALVALSRRLARTAWSIYKHDTLFDAARLTTPIAMQTGP